MVLALGCLFLSCCFAAHFPGSDLRNQLANGKLLPQIKFKPGVYDFTDFDFAAHFVVRMHSNQVLDFTGVEINATKCDQAAIIRFMKSTNLTVKGLRMDCDPSMGTQGTITSVGSNYRTVDVDIDKGYRTDIFSNSHSANPALRPPLVFDKDGKDYVPGAPTFNIQGPGVTHIENNASRYYYTNKQTIKQTNK